MNPCENYCKPFSAQCQLGILVSPWKSRIAVGFQNVPLFASDETLARKESSFIQGKLILGVIDSLLFLFLSPHLLLSYRHLYRSLCLREEWFPDSIHIRYLWKVTNLTGQLSCLILSWVAHIMQSDPHIP